MRRHLLSLIFGLIILAPSLGIACDDAKSTDGKSAAMNQDQANRSPTSQKDEQNNLQEESAKDRLFSISPFMKK